MIGNKSFAILRIPGGFKVFILYLVKSKVEIFKKLNTSFDLPSQRLWSMVNTPENLENVKTLFGSKLKIERKSEAITQQPSFTLSPKSQEIIDQLQQKLTLKAYSPSMIL